MAERKDRMALLSRYDKLHLQRYQAKSFLNRYKEEWAADGLIESYGLTYCYDLLEYYFEVSPSPTWKSFANSASIIIEAREQYSKDRLERAERRKKAKEWLDG